MICANKTLPHGLRIKHRRSYTVSALPFTHQGHDALLGGPRTPDAMVEKGPSSFSRSPTLNKCWKALLDNCVLLGCPSPRPIMDMSHCSTGCRFLASVPAVSINSALPRRASLPRERGCPRECLAMWSLPFPRRMLRMWASMCEVGYVTWCTRRTSYKNCSTSLCGTTEVHHGRRL